MKSNENISKAQMIYITINVLLGPAMIILTGLPFAKRDTFICEIIGFILGIILAFMMSYVVDSFPNMEYTEILDRMFKPMGGRIIASIYLIFAVLLLLMMENNVAGLVTNMVMTKTPPLVIIITITFISAYILSKGIEKFSFNVEIFTPALLGMLSFIYIVLWIKMGDLSNMQPIFTENIATISKGTIDIFSFPYVDACILIFIYSLSNKNFRKYKVVYVSYLVAAPFLLLRSVVVIAVLGLSEASRFSYPLFEATRLIQIGDYIERLELILLIVWVISSYIKITTYYYVIIKCIEYIFKLSDYRKLSVALAIFVTPISLNVISSIEDIYNNSYFTPIKIPILIITILVFIRAIFYSKKNKRKSKPG